MWQRLWENPRTLSSKSDAEQSPAEAPAKSADGLPTLPTSLVNQELLVDVLHNVALLCENHKSESRAEFKRPLVWQSGLKPAAFQGSTLWNVQSGPRNGKPPVVSAVARIDGQPFFQLDQVPGESGFVAKVSSFEYLHHALQAAEDQKLHELQRIIRANRDPLTLIFGVPSSSETSTESILIEAFESVTSERDPKKREQNGQLYKLLLVLNKMDLKLMKDAVKALERNKRLDIGQVTEELQMLQAFTGKEEQNVLLAIDWESDYTFSNGCKAPPWRQVYGEISYISAQPMDREPMIITASKSGYFVNKGYCTDDKGNQRLNYERDSNDYPTLVALFRDQSKYFAEMIDQQGYFYYQEQSSREETIPRSANAAEGATAPDGRGDQDLTDDEKTDSSNFGNIGSGSAREDAAKRGGHKKKTGKAVAQKRNITEPSLKWRTLALDPEQIGKVPSAKTRKKKGHSNPTSAKSGKRSGKSHGSGIQVEEDLTESDSDGTSDEEAQDKRQENVELPAEYYQIQKLVKYLRCGNQTATIIAICSLRDFDLNNESNQIAIRDVGGLDTLVNLLDTDDPKCKIGALKILKEISQNVQIRCAIADLDGMKPLIELLQDSSEELKCLAAETIAYCAKNARNRRSVRRYGGIRKLVKLLKARPGSKDEDVAISGALALSTCSKSSKNKAAIQTAGAIPLLANLLESQNEKLLIPVVGILQECASDENYRVAIRESGMIRFLVENLASKNEELQTHCASAIFKCAEDDETRALVRQYNGLVPLVNLLDNPGNRELLVAATGAVWKCAQNIDNVAALNKLNSIKKLIGLMENQPEDVLVNVVGALGACAQTPEGRQGIREGGGITPLVNLLTGTNQLLLVNVTRAVGASALESDSMAIIDRLDGVRLLWSLLKSTNHHVQASAAWAISPCIEHAKDAGEMVRSFVGGLELIVSLLKSEHTEVLASVCAAIANIAKDEENLAVITDHGVVPMLGKLTNTRNDKLRKHLAEAIATCCHWGNNRVAFGAAGAVAPLVKYLKSTDEEVHRSTARALHQLSMDADNCITMHEHGVVQLLLGMVGASDQVLQEAAAGTIGNIRRLALASEKAAITQAAAAKNQ
ncbi:armadillo-type protein [Polychytrium aggregatum]|uniref:armadillo-type protein n=1 Tax=Polychytrium aggregatum TaxID=110093 RepID=UPI0022FE1E89|nr:armadillo-type protein [Polychytrium aggregatum]KAI9201905.1 armadillo-type protein [Polychytrium aggregatum]